MNIIIVPWQTKPFPENPVLQMQFNVPPLPMHTAFMLQFMVSQILISNVE